MTTHIHSNRGAALLIVMFFIVVAGVLMATLTSQVITSVKQADVFAASNACLHGIEYALAAATTDAAHGGPGAFGVNPAQQGAAEADSPSPVFGGPGVTPVLLTVIPPVECYAQCRRNPTDAAVVTVFASARSGDVVRSVKADYRIDGGNTVSQLNWLEIKPE